MAVSSLISPKMIRQSQIETFIVFVGDYVAQTLE